MSGTADLVELRALAERVARDAGALLLEGADRARAEVSTKSTGTDMVTEMDRASEALITAGLLGARPDDGILGEEGVDSRGTSGVRWVVDPLDGTTNYLYGFPGYNVSIAAEVDGQAVVGVVFDVVRHEVFSAVRGAGATRDGAPIRCSEATRLGDALVGTGFSYEPDRRRHQAQVLVDVLPRVRDLRRQGAAALDLCSVACGRLDAYWEKGLAPWDLAAGGLIAAEAGAVVRALAGGPPVAGSVVAAAPGVADAMLELLASTGAASA
ncbi:MAG: inositol monophosphatase family protein [Acidimicrobiales bacterium]